LLARREHYLLALDHDPGHRHRRRRGLRAVLDALDAAGGESWQACDAEVAPGSWLPT
jgi:hypothetical protein